MYELDDTIVAVSSPTIGKRVIVRISGRDTIEQINQLFSPPIVSVERWSKGKGWQRGLVTGTIAIDNDLKIGALLYLFLGPHSYTGEDVAEVHIIANPAVIQSLISNLLSRGLRMAGPGEFTARAYLNGKIDLAQAEAVNEVIVSSNAIQLSAAERLLRGQLAQISASLRSAMMDCLSLIEAGLDFSGEDIEFITRDEAGRRLAEIRDQLERLLASSIRYESVIDLPAVGITGAPNAGKSSLLNKLLGEERSIVSDECQTTRDVLTDVLKLAHFRCVLFDCAGLMPGDRREAGIQPDSILDELAQRAAIEALQNACVVVFCVDISKADWSEDIAIRELIEPKVLLPVATKSDLLCPEVLVNRVAGLNKLFGAEFLPISVETGSGVELLREMLDRKLLQKFEVPGASGVALTARHQQALKESIENLSESIGELKGGNDEVAAMMLRAAYQGLCDIESAAGGHVDEQILERIFSRFCIGK